NPFDMFTLNTNDWNYNKADWPTMQNNPDQVGGVFGDSLSHEGYMARYPRDPFMQGPRTSIKYGIDALINASRYWYCWGGRDGSLMFNTGWMSERPILEDFEDNANDIHDLIKNSFPGEFHYHTRWQDG